MGLLLGFFFNRSGFFDLLLDLFFRRSGFFRLFLNNFGLGFLGQCDNILSGEIFFCLQLGSICRL